MSVIQILMSYFDVQLQRNTVIGELLEVDKTRAEELLKHPMGLITIIENY